MRYLLIASLLLAGCAGLGAAALNPEDVAETVKLLEAAKASGCFYLRARGNPPASHVELDAIYSFGGSSYIECLKALRR